MGAPELLIIAVIVLLVFGSSKLGDVGGAVGRSIREFRKAAGEDADTPSVSASIIPTPSLAPPARDAQLQSVDGVGRFCAECGNGIAEGQKFCSRCGTRIATPASE
jgi:sec-independent protein translocase protein TatA